MIGICRAGARYGGAFSGGALLLAAVTAAGQTLAAQMPAAQEQGMQSHAGQQQIWRFDRLDSIGGHAAHIVGSPQLIDTPAGKAMQFNGVSDGIFVDDHPLAGAAAYTWEVIFRPDADGPAEQRFFHLQEQDAATGEDTMNRMLFETRIVDGQWCLDSFASSGESTRALLNCKLLHPVGRWYRVTAVYDGKTLRNYVDGEMEGEGPLDLKPQMQGRSSIGVRINKVYWFKGAVLMARMTPRALKPEEFLTLPAGLNR
jgi:hypothetical protein